MGIIRDIHQRTKNSVMRRLRPLTRSHPCDIVVACMPKSGSTYMSRLLMEAAGLKKTDLTTRGDWGEQFLSKRKLKQKIGSGKGSVCHIHLRGTPQTRQLIKEFNLKPIIVVRNIYDIVPSIADHWHREQAVGFGSYVPENFKAMEREQLYDFIIANCIPWYFAFFSSWHEASKEIDTFWVAYDDFFSNQEQRLIDMLDFSGTSYNRESAIQAIDTLKSRWTRLNKGVTGRGESLLLPRQKQAIRTIADTWMIDQKHYEIIGLND